VEENIYSGFGRKRETVEQFNKGFASGRFLTHEDVARVIREIRSEEIVVREVDGYHTYVRGAGSGWSLLKTSPYGVFVEELVEMLMDTFAPMYQKVYRPLWNNGVYSEVKRPYYYVDHDSGILEFYVPTCLNGEGFMQYNRIVVRVLPELDLEVWNSERRSLEHPFTSPAGLIDSESIFLVAPSATEEWKRRFEAEKRMEVARFFREKGLDRNPRRLTSEELEELRRRKHSVFWRVKVRGGIRHRNKKGYMTYFIIRKSAQQAYMAIMQRLKKFWEKRVKGLLEKVNVEPYHYDYKLENIPSTNGPLIEWVYPTIKHNLHSMVKTFIWFRDAVKSALREIKALALLKSRVLPLINELKKDVKYLLNRRKNGEIRFELPSEVVALAEALGV